MSNSNLIIIAVSNSGKLKKFIEFPYNHYKDSPYWVAPLRIQQKQVFSRKKNPFYEFCDMELFLAVKNNEVVGRIAAIKNKVHNNLHNDKTGFFGFFEAINDQQTCNALLETAGNWLKKEGLDTMRGPVSPTTNNESGFLASGFDDSPRLMMPYTPQYYLGLMETGGLKRCKQLLAYKIMSKEVAENEKIKRVVDLVKKRYNVILRQINMKRFNEEIALIAKIYNECWSDNWGFVPISDRDAILMAKSLKPIVEPSLIQIAEIDGKAIGMIVTLYDFNEVLKKLKGNLFPFGVFSLINAKKRISWLRMMLIGIIPEYRRKGIDALLYYQASVNACKLGKNFCEGSWTLEDNDDINKIALMMGGIAYKKYSIYEKNI